MCTCYSCRWLSASARRTTLSPSACRTFTWLPLRVTDPHSSGGSSLRFMSPALSDWPRPAANTAETVAGKHPLPPPPPPLRCPDRAACRRTWDIWGWKHFCFLFIFSLMRRKVHGREVTDDWGTFGLFWASCRWWLRWCCRTRGGKIRRDPRPDPGPGSVWVQLRCRNQLPPAGWTGGQSLTLLTGGIKPLPWSFYVQSLSNPPASELKR